MAARALAVNVIDFPLVVDDADALADAVHAWPDVGTVVGLGLAVAVAVAVEVGVAVAMEVGVEVAVAVAVDVAVAVGDAVLVGVAVAVEVGVVLVEVAVGALPPLLQTLKPLAIQPGAKPSGWNVKVCVPALMGTK